MKLWQAQQSQNEILYKKHPYRLQSKCLLCALDAHNMLLTSLGQQKQKKHSYEDHRLFKTWTVLISLIIELPGESSSSLSTTRSACCKWMRPDDSYIIFGSEGKIFNPIFEKIILKPLNPDVESRNKLLVSTACTTVIFWTNWKPAASTAFLKTPFFFIWFQSAIASTLCQILCDSQCHQKDIQIKFVEPKLLMKLCCLSVLE